MFTENALLLLFFIAVIWLLQYHWQRRHLYRLAKEVHGPRPLPVVGNALRLITNADEILVQMLEIGKEYPPPCKFWMGPKLMYAINDPVNLQILLNNPNCLDKDTSYAGFLGNVLGKGLLTAPLPIWKNTRKILAPFFNNQNMNQFVASFGKHANILIEEDLTKLADEGSTVNIIDYIDHYTLGVIFEVTLGVTLDTQTCHRLGKTITRAVQICNKRIMTFWQYPDFVFNRIPKGKEYRKLEIEFLGTMQKIIVEKRSDHSTNSNRADMENFEGANKKRKTYLDYLVNVAKTEEFFTDDHMRHEIITLVTAGYDTSTLVTSFMLLALALHPEVQQNAFDEVCEILDCERAPNPTDLARLVYLDKVLKETLRLFPPGAITSHMVNSDIKLPNFTLASGSTLIVPILEMHRNENYWPDPLKFDPERFSPEEMKKRHPYCYIPFYAGPRNCIGIKFATKSIKCVVACIIRKFKIHTQHKSVQDVKLRLDILLSPVDGFKISLERRKM